MCQACFFLRDVGTFFLDLEELYPFKKSQGLKLNETTNGGAELITALLRTFTPKEFVRG